MELFFSSLYVHVPFCLKKCKYCNFYSINWDKETERIYIQSIIKEIELTSRIPHSLETLYIGGGTSSCLGIKSMEKLFERLNSSFKSEKNIEFSMEVNPATVNREKIKMMKDFGINRLSIGVQSFNDKELKILGRIHNSEEATKTIELAINSGFNNISVDLIYGIPEQTVKSFYESLKKAISFDVKHISIYELTLEKETSLIKEINSGKFSLPLEDEVISMYEMATKFLNSKSFKKYEISNFAKQNYECKHNIAYWTRKSYLGLGPSAHSYIGERRFHNPSDIYVYCHSLSESRLPWIYDREVKGLETLKENIFLGLRMGKGIFIDNPCLIEFFKEFEKENLVIVSGNRIALTDKGMLVSNEIFAEVLLHIDNCPVCKQG